jgi:hypothetical protein
VALSKHVENLLSEAQGIKLDIGCGEAPIQGCVGMDIRDLPTVDIVWDVNIHPWPLPDECVIHAFASHLVEHIPPVIVDKKEGTWFPFVEFMNDLWRVTKPDGQFAVSGPYWLSQGYAQDPTHCNPINEMTFSYFAINAPEADPGFLWKIYKPKPWKLEHIVWDVSANFEAVLRKIPDERPE